MPAVSHSMRHGVFIRVSYTYTIKWYENSKLYQLRYIFNN